MSEIDRREQKVIRERDYRLSREIEEFRQFISTVEDQNGQNEDIEQSDECGDQ